MGYVEKLIKVWFTVGKLRWKSKLHKNFFLYWIVMKSVEQLLNTGKHPFMALLHFIVD